TNVQQWLNDYRWEAPPQLAAEGRLVLPAWTHGAPAWTDEVGRSLELRGQFQAGVGGYRGFTFSAAESPFSLTNLAWRLSDLKVVRPEGALQGEYTGDEDTHQFHWRLRSTIDAKAVRSLLEKEAQRAAVDFFEFTTTPAVAAEVWGNWRDLDHVSFLAQIAATNFTFRGETVKECRTTLIYTNEFLSFIAPEVLREGERGTALG